MNKSLLIIYAVLIAFIGCDDSKVQEQNAKLASDHYHEKGKARKQQ